MKSRFVNISIVLVVLALTLMPETASAQCAMCKAAAEQSIREGSTQAAGLNTGILYLAVFPYLVVGTLGFIAWRHWRKKRLEANVN